MLTFHNIYPLLFAMFVCWFVYLAIATVQYADQSEKERSIIMLARNKKI